MLEPIVIRAPGFGGLNLEGEDVVPAAQFAKVANNLFFDKSGRLSARKGFSQLLDEAGVDAVESIFVLDNAIDRLIIFAGSGKIYITNAGFDTAYDITPSITITANKWQFQMFADDGNLTTASTAFRVIGAQADHKLIEYALPANFPTSAGQFTEVTHGPHSNDDHRAISSAFGRIWAAIDSGRVIEYSRLLKVAFNGAGSGVINILANESALRNGFDSITAIAPLEDNLVVFLKDSIVIWDGPEDPASMTIVKTVQGVGCVARDSIQQIGNDLVFLSRDGLRSLRKSLVEANFGLTDLSRPVRTQFLIDVANKEDVIRSAYYPEDGIYILLIPGGANGKCYVFDFKRRFEDGMPRVTTWTAPHWNSIYYHQGDLFVGHNERIGTYAGYYDHSGASATTPYAMEYLSLNVDFGTPRMKMLKRFNMIVQGSPNQIISADRAFDFSGSVQGSSVSIPATSSISEFQETDTASSSVHEFCSDAQVDSGTFAQFGSGAETHELAGTLSGSGEVVSLGVNSTVQGNPVAIEQLTYYATQGRFAR